VFYRLIVISISAISRRIVDNYPQTRGSVVKAIYRLLLEEVRLEKSIY